MSDTTNDDARRHGREDHVRPRRPNIIMVVLDDCGFAQLGCFGSEMQTPNVDALAEDGLRFNAYHVTALCSPTRACLLTGRNHHAVGMGLFPEVPGASPGTPAGSPTACGRCRERCATRATARSRSASGTSRRWASAVRRGRSRGGRSGSGSSATTASSARRPTSGRRTLVADNHAIPSPANVGDGYHLSEDLAGQAIKMIRDQHQASPDRPFFLYFATGRAARPAPRRAGVERPLPRPVRRRLGRHARPGLRAPDGARRRPAGNEPHASPLVGPAVGRALRRRARAVRPHARGLRRRHVARRRPDRADRAGRGASSAWARTP